MTSRRDRDFLAGFRDVDATGDSARLADYLDAVTAMLREHKLALLEALQLGEGDSAIDVGCGVGDDVLLLAERVGSGGHAVGVDLSANLLARRGPGRLGLPARRSSGSTHMPFPSGMTVSMARVSSGRCSTWPTPRGLSVKSSG